MKSEGVTHLIDKSAEGNSPWSMRERLGILLWEYCWAIFCSWTPKPFYPWRLFWLRLFRARIHGHPFVHQRMRVQIPWNLELHEGACIGDRANLYTLAKIEIGAGTIIAQEAYVCTGTHSMAVPGFPLAVAPIVIGENSFIGARAFLMPGIKIGSRSVIGACSVLTRSVGDDEVWAGNPARRIDGSKYK